MTFISSLALIRESLVGTTTSLQSLVKSLGRKVSVPLALLGLAACATSPTEVPSEPPTFRAARASVSATDSGLVTVYVESHGVSTQLAKARLRSKGGRSLSPHPFGRWPVAVKIPRDSLEGVRGLTGLRVVLVDSSPPLRMLSRNRRSFSPSGFTPFARVVDNVPWGIAAIGASDVHSAYGNTGAGVKVAILDDGIDCTISDLSGRIVGGYDFVDDVASGCTGAGNHGTPAATVLAGNLDGSGVVGVAPNASLYGLRVCGATTCDRGRIYDALVWALSNGIQVISASLGDCGNDPPSFLTKSVIAALHANQVVQVWSGGNGREAVPQCEFWELDDVSSFAAADFTIGVAAHTYDESYKVLYQYGPEIDLSAPTGVESRGPGGVFAMFEGTSAATPHVAGAAALLLSAGFTGAQVLDRLTETAAPAGPAGKDDYYGWGLLRVGAAAVPRARVDSVSWCTGTAITVAGTCSINAYTTNGIGSVQLRFEVTFSNSAVVDVYDWGASSRSITVPTGDYTLTVKAIPRDPAYQRIGYHSFQDIPVCTGGMARSRGGSGTDAVGGCGSGGGEALRSSRSSITKGR